MAEKLPPLTALRAFEAAGRHLSFARAADELNVSAAAISHQIRLLEDHLQISLFYRDPNGVRLTAEGAQCLPGISEGFTQIRQSLAPLQQAAEQPVLTVSIAPTFALKWLLPRLGEFTQQYPGIDIRLSTSAKLVDFTSQDIDMALRYGSGQYEGVITEKLFEERLIPLYNPKIITDKKPLVEIADLGHHTLLHDQASCLNPAVPTWQDWLQIAGGNVDLAKHGVWLSYPYQSLEAALDGAGIVLGGTVLAEKEMKAGRLIPAFETVEMPAPAFYLVYPPEKQHLSRLQLFRKWLLTYQQPDVSQDI